MGEQSMTKENYRPIFIYEVTKILATQTEYNKFDQLILKFMWKRKRAKNNGEYFEEDQVWENLPYQRPKFIIKLHRLRVWYRQRDRETDQWNRQNTKRKLVSQSW